MEFPKDVYEYITNFVDDKTILNMLSVNKKFRDEEIFERIMRKRYPLLIDLKSKNQIWKDFYIEMIYYIKKIKEKYDIPYIPTQGYNPKIFWKKYYYNKKILENEVFDEASYFAVQGEHMDIVKLMFEKGARSYETLAQLARESHIDIIKYMIVKGVRSFNWIMIHAAVGGHMNIIKLMLEKGATGFDESMAYAASGGHVDIVNLMIEKGATDFDRAIRWATREGQTDIVKLLKVKFLN